MIIRRPPGYGATDTSRNTNTRKTCNYSRKKYAMTRLEPNQVADLVFFRCEKSFWPVAHGPDGLTATVVYYALSQ